MEAVVKQARTTRHAWLIACDANMCPEDFEKSLWFQTCSSRRQGKASQLADQKARKGELIERTYGYVVASRSLQEKIRNMEVVEDFESRRHKAVSFVVEREKEFQEWREQQMPEALPGFSGGRLPGRSKAEEGKEKEDEEKESQETKMRNEVA